MRALLGCWREGLSGITEMSVWLIFDLMDISVSCGSKFDYVFCQYFLITV